MNTPQRLATAGALIALAACTDSPTLTDAPVSAPEPSFAISASGGGVNHLASAPASVAHGALASDQHAFVFAERTDLTLAGALSVTVAEPGTYTSTSVEPAVPATGASIAAGTTVTSYFVHMDVPAAIANDTVTGTITFDSDVLGVILTNEGLDATDATLGAPGTTYATGDPSRRTVSGEKIDVVTISADRRTVQFTAYANNVSLDQFRVVTAGNAPDTSPPTITFTGNAGTYTVDQTINITCSATDAGSGVAQSTCPGASGPAYTFAPGSHTLTATATDNAGNTATATATFTVVVTHDGVCALVHQFVSQHGVAHSLCQQLKNGAYGAFNRHLHAQTGKTVSAEHAAILIRYSHVLKQANR